MDRGDNEARQWSEELGAKKADLSCGPNPLPGFGDLGGQPAGYGINTGELLGLGVDAAVKNQALNNGGNDSRKRAPLLVNAAAPTLMTNTHQTVSDFNQPSIPSGVANNATDKAQTYSIDDSNTTLLIDGPKAVQPKACVPLIDKCLRAMNNAPPVGNTSSPHLQPRLSGTQIGQAFVPALIGGGGVFALNAQPQGAAGLSYGRAWDNQAGDANEMDGQGAGQDALAAGAAGGARGGRAAGGGPTGGGDAGNQLGQEDLMPAANVAGDEDGQGAAPPRRSTRAAAARVSKLVALQAEEHNDDTDTDTTSSSPTPAIATDKGDGKGASPAKRKAPPMTKEQQEQLDAKLQRMSDAQARAARHAVYVRAYMVKREAEAAARRGAGRRKQRNPGQAL